MQSVAALETEIMEVCIHGPGCHKGSNGTDHEGHAFLKPLAEVIDNLSGVLNRYDTVLHLLKKPRLDHGNQIWNDSTLLVALRNELVHYKSRWGVELAERKLIERLKQKNFKPPPWNDSPSVAFFPHQCLSADCAKWTVKVAIAIIEAFYASLGKPSWIDDFRSRLIV